MTSLTLHSLDAIIIAVYFVAVLALGLWFARSTKSGDDLFLAGRTLTWAPIGLSLFASNISSTTLIGLAGAAYATGISVANYEWMAAVVLVVFVFFIVPVYIRSRISTAPEYLEHRFDRRSRVYFSGLTIVANVLVDMAGSLYAGAMVLRLFIPNMDITTTCFVLALVAGVYTAAGGLAAVVYTDVLQAVILLAGSVVLTVVVFARTGMSWGELVAATPPEMLSLIRPLDDPNLPWLGTLIGVPVLGFYFWCTNQFIVQRVFAARDLRHARWGALFGGALKLPVLFIMVLPGTMARHVFPDLQSPDMVFPTMVTELLPVGLVGLVLAGLVAAIMSSVDSTLNSASTLVTLDFVQRRDRNLTPEQVLRVGRIVMVIFMVIAAAWAPNIARFQGLFAYLQHMLSYIVPPVAVVFLWGMLTPRGRGRAALGTLLCGHGMAVLVFTAERLGWLELHFTLVAGALFVACALCFEVLARWDAATPRDAAAPAVPTLASMPREAEAPGPWWADHRVLSGALLAVTAVIVVAFW